MKIVRYQKENEINYGVLEDGTISPIEGYIFNKFSRSYQKVKKEDVRLLAPLMPPNIIAIGLNYKGHAKESGMAFPEKPVIFLKATSSVVGQRIKLLFRK